MNMQARKPSSKRSYRIHLIVVFTFVVILAWIHLREHKPVTVDLQQYLSEWQDQQSSDEISQELLDELQRKLRHAGDQYLERVLNYTEKSRRELHRIVGESMKHVAEVSTQSAAPFQGVKNLTYCVYMMTEDKLLGTDMLQEHMVDALQPVITLNVDTRNRLLAVMEVLRVELESNLNQYRTEVLQLTESAQVPAGSLRLDQMNVILSELDAYMGDAGNAYIVVGIEAIAAKSIYKVIKSGLSVVAKRLATTGVAAGTAAAVDGPSPIGKVVGAVIAVGGVAWTGWDVYALSRQNQNLPDEIASHVEQSLQSLQEQSLQWMQQAHQAYQQQLLSHDEEN
jgi:hypothetical protein